MEAVYVLSLILFVYCLIQLIFGGLVFIVLRKEEVIRRRTAIFSFLTWLGLFAAVMQTFSNFFPVGDCFFQFVVWKSILPGPIIVDSVRCLKLFFYDIYMRMLIHDKISSREASDKSKRRISTKLMLIVYCCLHFAIQWLVLIIDGIWMAANGIDNLNEGCKNDIVTIGAVMLSILFIASLLFFTWKLWKIHDAFFLKNEMKIIAISALLFGFPGFGLTFTQDLKLVGFLFIMLVYCFHLTASFGIVGCLAIKSRLITKGYIKVSSLGTYFEKKTASESEMSSSSSSSFYSVEPEISKILDSKEGRDCLNQYLIYTHAQDLAVTLQLFIAIEKYQNMQQELKPAELMRIHHWFIERDAFTEVKCIDDTERNKIGSYVAILQDDKEVAEPLITSAFEDIGEKLKKVLMEELFIPFCNSKYYKDMILKIGMLTKV